MRPVTPSPAPRWSTRSGAPGRRAPPPAGRTPRSRPPPPRAAGGPGPPPRTARSRRTERRRRPPSTATSTAGSPPGRRGSRRAPAAGGRSPPAAPCGPGPRETSAGRAPAGESRHPSGRDGGPLHLGPDPSVRLGEPVLQAHARLPPQHRAEAGVVAVATPDALRPGRVMPLPKPLAGDRADQVDQAVDGDHLVGSQVQGRAVVRLGDSEDALHAVVDEGERAGLPAVSPHLDLVAVARGGHLPADGGGGLLAPPVVGTQRPVDVVEPGDAGLQAVVLA